MPCMMNGMPVPGAKGSCPIGSTWVEDEFMAVNAIQNDVALDKAMKPASSNQALGLIKDNFMNKTQGIRDFIMNTNPTRMGESYATSDTLFPKDASQKPKPAFMNDAQRMQQLDSSPKEPKKLSAMAGLMENMRNPEWWGQSMSGLPGDTRLMRLGQLMNYYGQTPQQRLKNKQPAELWAANEAAAQKNKAAVLAAGAKRADEIYGKKSIEDLATDVLADVKEMFGDRMFTISSNPDASDEDAMASLASQVATNIKAITLAYPDKTPGEVRKLALEQLMRDRDLDDLR